MKIRTRVMPAFIPSKQVDRNLVGNSEARLHQKNGFAIEQIEEKALFLPFPWRANVISSTSLDHRAFPPPTQAIVAS
jgi:hypothetical protein